ncbi:uncharacterized protein LOC143497972 isoform X2 [Brachyhypopomus gauderio]|uniref:uncharacterized protein LOC143497972 isoform X2 n=1 Tax=Brachyhypopomus gauderio TaxID=698409 RepID=UPI004042299C
MSSWAGSAGGRRPPPNLNPNCGGPKPLRAFRRQPYPPAGDRKDVHHEPESYENVGQRDDYSGTLDYKTYELSPPQSHLKHHPGDGDKRGALYQRLYQQFYGDGAKKPADCVVLSVNNQNLEYPKSLGHSLQERGLSVETLYLQAESGLTRALQDVRSDGSPLCILVEQTNVTLSSCTVIIFSESLKIHRNMPKEQAMEFVAVEFGRLGGGRGPRDPAEAGARAAELTDDYLERAKLERHAVPSSTRHLLFLMAEGLHLYPEELATVAEYVQNRQDHLQASASTELENEEGAETLSSLPAVLSGPPPLLPNPVTPGPSLSEHTTLPAGAGEPGQGHLLGVPDSYPKTKPPPLLSVSVLQGSPHRPAAAPAPMPRGPAPLPRGPAPLRAPPALHGPSTSHPPPFGPPSRGPPAPRGPSAHHSLTGLRGPPALHGPSQQGSPGPHAPPTGRGLTEHAPPTGRGLSEHAPIAFHQPRGLLHPRGPPLLRGPPPQNGPGGHRGLLAPHGTRAPPPSLLSLHMGNTAGPPPRPARRLLP